MDRLPRLYRRLVAIGMDKWGPWDFLDDAASLMGPANLNRSKGLQEQFCMESNADFGVYLFARRRDQDEFAFFHVTAEGIVEDSVLRAHLSFSKGPDHFTPAQPVARTSGWI